VAGATVAGTGVAGVPQAASAIEITVNKPTNFQICLNIFLSSI
jgi:hypothetical protein